MLYLPVVLASSFLHYSPRIVNYTSCYTTLLLVCERNPNNVCVRIWKRTSKTFNLYKATVRKYRFKVVVHRNTHLAKSLIFWHKSRDQTNTASIAVNPLQDTRPVKKNNCDGKSLEVWQSMMVSPEYDCCWLLHFFQYCSKCTLSIDPFYLTSSKVFAPRYGQAPTSLWWVSGRNRFFCFFFVE